MNYQYNTKNIMPPPPLPPFTLMANMNSVSPVEASQSHPFIGPIVPENTHQNEDMHIEDDNDDADDSEVQFASTTYNEKLRGDREKGK